MTVSEFARNIKELRLVSISALTFISYILYDFMQWVQTSEPESLGEGIAITGIMSALALTYRFIFQFATSGRASESDKDSTE